MKRQCRGKARENIGRNPGASLWQLPPLATSLLCYLLSLVHLSFLSPWLGSDTVSSLNLETNTTAATCRDLELTQILESRENQLLPSTASLQCCNGNSRELGAGGSTGGLSTSLVDRVTAATRTCSSLFLLQYPKLSKRKGSQLLGKPSKASQRSPTPKARLWPAGKLPKHICWEVLYDCHMLPQIQLKWDPSLAVWFSGFFSSMSLSKRDCPWPHNVQQCNHW